MQTLQYAPLNTAGGPSEIRLLELFAGDGNIQCSIRHVTLSNAPNYEALSYCWGDISEKVRIVCNEAYLAITKNLYAALRRLRDGRQSRTLWVDAICIDQSNMNERNSQVALMREIYASCSGVIIWLGEEDKFTKTSFDFAKRLANHAEKGDPVPPNPDHENFTKGSKNKDLPSIYSTAWRNVLRTFCKGWFLRMWIIQEVAFGPTLHMICGRHEIAWEDLRKACMSFKWVCEELRRLQEQRDLIQSKVDIGFSKDLVRLVVEHRESLATDPRDKLYALCGLANEASRCGIEPDYHNSVEKTFLDFTVTQFKATHRLDLLCAMTETPSRQRFRPSWVYNEAYSSLVDPITSFIFDPWHDFNAAQGFPSTAQFSADERLLQLTGLQFDTIEVVGQLSPGSSNQELPPLSEALPVLVTALMRYVEWRDLAQVSPSRPYCNTSESRLEAFWQTCMGSATAEFRSIYRGKFRKFDRELRCFHHLPQSLKSRRLVYILLVFAKLLEIPAKVPFGGLGFGFMDFAYYTSPRVNRIMFRTIGGYIGLGPRSTAVGDSVTILKGARVPLVLRPSNDRWRLLGEAYVHGIMFGEAFDEDKCQSMWLE